MKKFVTFFLFFLICNTSPAEVIYFSSSPESYTKDVYFSSSPESYTTDIYFSSSPESSPLSSTEVSPNFKKEIKTSNLFLSIIPIDIKNEYNYLITSRKQKH